MAHGHAHPHRLVHGREDTARSAVVSSHTGIVTRDDESEVAPGAAPEPDGPANEPGPSANELAVPGRGSPLEVLGVALRLGLTSFGGPVAHLGYFRTEYVERRRWLDAETYGALLAICQSLPGPASSQVGIAIGTIRAGRLGGIAAWLGFTLPSAMALVAFAALTSAADVANSGWLHGIRLVAVPVVAVAAAGLARTLTPDWPRRLIAFGALLTILLAPGVPTQLALIGAGAGVGAVGLHGRTAAIRAPRVAIGRPFAIACIALFFALLVGVPLVRAAMPDGDARQAVALSSAFYQSGALVFGGGHVVLPLLDQAIVAPGWVSADRFLAGYGAAQAVPGPLFSFAGYLGWSAQPSPNGPVGAGIALVAIFLPSFLLLFGLLPLWPRVAELPRASAALAGVNAAVVGLLVGALYTPVWTGSVTDLRDVAIVALDLIALALLRLPSWLVVVLSAIAGALVLNTTA